MSVVLLDYFKVTLTEKLTKTGAKLPLSSSDASALCAKLGANETDLVVDGPMGAEIVRAACLQGQVCITRGPGAMNHPAGACVTPTLTNASLAALAAAAVASAMCSPTASEAVFDCNGVLIGRMMLCGAVATAPTNVPIQGCDGTTIGYLPVNPL
jgi:hypothetical protein